MCRNGLEYVPGSLNTIWDVILDLVGQVPHNHPSQDKLVQMLIKLKEFADNKK
jgi:hypothetical protein